MLGLAFASRGRPDQFHKTLSEISKAKAEPDTFLSVRLDEDDPKLKLYRPANYFKGEVKCEVGPRLAKGSAPHINRAAMEAYRYGATLIMQVADDQSFEEGAGGFDIELKRAARCLSDDIGLFYTGDTYLNAAQVSHPIVTRKWIETLGFFYSREYVHFYADTELMEIARGIGRLFYVQDLSIKHMKHAFMDELYYGIRQGPGPEDDLKVFEGRVGARAMAMGLLRAQAQGPVVV